MGSYGHTNGHTNGQANGHLDLPHRNSPDIRLVVATPEELDAQQLANSDEWKGALSLDAYLRREAHLADQELTKDGGITGWALIHQPEGSSERRALCGCETIKKRALVGRNGKVE